MNPEINWIMIQEDLKCSIKKIQYMYIKVTACLPNWNTVGSLKESLVRH